MNRFPQVIDLSREREILYADRHMVDFDPNADPAISYDGSSVPLPYSDRIFSELSAIYAKLNGDVEEYRKVLRTKMHNPVLLLDGLEAGYFNDVMANDNQWCIKVLSPIFVSLWESHYDFGDINNDNSYHMLHSLVRVSDGAGFVKFAHKLLESEELRNPENKELRKDVINYINKFTHMGVNFTNEGFKFADSMLSALGEMRDKAAAFMNGLINSENSAEILSVLSDHATNKILSFYKEFPDVVEDMNESGAPISITLALNGIEES